MGLRLGGTTEESREQFCLVYLVDANVTYAQYITELNFIFLSEK